MDRCFCKNIKIKTRFYLEDIMNENRSTKTTITKNEYFELLGLKILSDKYQQKLDDITHEAVNITGEIDYNGKAEYYGFTSDMLGDAGDAQQIVDDYLEKLGLIVEE
jgi:hypothetical protein